MRVFNELDFLDVGGYYPTLDREEGLRCLSTSFDRRSTTNAFINHMCVWPPNGSARFF